MNTYTTHNETRIDITGTHLVGTIQCRYEKLATLFGNPELGDGYKTDAEWTIQFDDGTIAVIYNHKNGKNYLGENGTETEDIFFWNVGGLSIKAHEAVLEAISADAADIIKKRLHAHIQKQQAEYDETMSRIANILKATSETIKEIEALIRKA